MLDKTTGDTVNKLQTATKKIIGDFASADEGVLLALTLVTQALIESGALNQEALLPKLDEALKTFAKKGVNPHLSNATLVIANSLDLDTFPLQPKNEFNWEEFIKNLPPYGGE